MTRSDGEIFDDWAFQADRLARELASAHYMATKVHRNIEEKSTMDARSLRRVLECCRTTLSIAETMDELADDLEQIG